MPSALRRCCATWASIRAIMQKGVMRIEPNISVRPLAARRLGTRTEIKNLNSFRALERSVGYEIQRQIALPAPGAGDHPGNHGLG